MELMRQIAYETVLRACGFGSLAIFCVMIGMSFDARLAFQAGGTLTVLMALILVFKSREARTKNYRHTEMWLYLPKESRPPEAYAQWASATVLRETYLTFALWTSGIAVAMWVMALALFFFGPEPSYSVEHGNIERAPARQSERPQPAGQRPPPSISYQIR